MSKKSENGVADDAAFGRELSPISGLPSHYVSDSLTAACDWLTRALGVHGYRIDDVKGLSTDFLRLLLESDSMAGKFAVGEFFNGDVNVINQWVFNPQGMQGRTSAFDFPLKFILGGVCNNPGGSDISVLDHAGLAGTSPLKAVTFVENHDTDLQPGASIVTNKALAYAYILTSEGYPCVYYKDYSTDSDCYGLEPVIDNLIWIHETLADGPTLQRWKDFNVFAYERLGGVHLLVGLNNDPNNGRTINVATGFGPNVGLHDYTGHAPDVVTDGNGNVTITIPQNANGLGYVSYSIQRGGFAVTPLPVTQDFDGAADLDILPAISGTAVQAGRIWCAANSPVRAVLKPVTDGWTAATAISVQLLAPDNTVLATQAYTLQTPLGTALQAVTGAEGFYTFRLTSSNTPAASPNPAFTLSATYTAPSVLTPKTATQSNPPIAAGNPAVTGQWSEIIPLPNVPIHTHVLPTVLVTGGTQGGGFNDLGPGGPVHTAELWNPTENSWQQLAPEAVDRCYHATVVLLPDGRVFSAGSGEFAAAVNVSNLPTDSHPNCQIFSPPYLFKGARPVITQAPVQLSYGESFVVQTPAPNAISQVTLIRLGSVTHSFNQNQRINFLVFKADADQLTVTAPLNGNVCSPGHYMLFLLNQAGVPSIANIIQIGAQVPPVAPAIEGVAIRFQQVPQKPLVAVRAPALNSLQQDAAIQTTEKVPPVVVGITPTCPYGISACWGGAYEALRHLSGVRLVRPMPNATDSTAYVYLQNEGLPDIAAWPSQFADIANGIYKFRGVEVTIEGPIQASDGSTLSIRGNDARPPLLLQPIQAADKIQWDLETGLLKPLDPLEESAFVRLQDVVRNASGSLGARVTGPLKESIAGIVLEVRQFSVPGKTSAD